MLQISMALLVVGLELPAIGLAAKVLGLHAVNGCVAAGASLRLVSVQRNILQALVHHSNT